MTKPLIEILTESLTGSLGTLKNLILIIIPMMIAIQLMTEYKLMERLSTRAKFITDFLGVSKDTLVTLLIGVFAGISYGAGAILDAKERFGLSRRDVFLVMCFLTPFHGVVEITLIFWLIGVNPAAVMLARFAVAAAAVLFAKALTKDKPEGLK